MGNIPLIYSIFIMFFPIISVFACTPYIGKKGSVFGVALPDEAKNNRVLRGMCRRYTVFSVTSGLCLAFTALMLGKFSAAVLCAAVTAVLCCAMFAANNRLVRNIIASEDYENLQKPVYFKKIPENLKPKTISMWWILLLTAPTAATFFDAYRSRLDIGFSIPAIQCAVIIACTAAFAAIKRAGQYADKSNAQKDIERNIAVRTRLSAMILCICLALCVFLMLMQLCASKTLNIPWFLNAAPFVMTIAVTWTVIIFCLKLK